MRNVALTGGWIMVLVMVGLLVGVTIAMLAAAPLRYLGGVIIIVCAAFAVARELRSLGLK